MTHNTRTSTLHSRFVFLWQEEDDIRKNIDTGWRPVNPANIHPCDEAAMTALMAWAEYENPVLHIEADHPNEVGGVPAKSRVSYKLVPDQKED